MNRKMVKGYLFVIASAVIYGCMPMMAKFIYAQGVNPLSLVLLRNLLALPPLAVLALSTKKTLLLPKKALPSIFWIALTGGAATPALLYLSYQYIASGTATVFHFVYPAVVVLLGFLFLKRPLDKVSVISVVLCVCGISLFYTPGTSLDWRGATLALVSGITYAIYILLMGAYRYKENSGFLLTFYIAINCVLVMLVIILATGTMALPQTFGGWLWCIFFAFSINVGAAYLFQQGTFLVGGERAGVLSTFEPITSVVSGILVFQEKTSFGTLLGTFIIIAAGIFIAVADAKKGKKESE